MSATQLAALARTTDPRAVLRRFLALDAVVTGANALAMPTVRTGVLDLCANQIGTATAGAGVFDLAPTRLARRRLGRVGKRRIGRCRTPAGPSYRLRP